MSNEVSKSIAQLRLACILFSLLDQKQTQSLFLTASVKLSVFFFFPGVTFSSFEMFDGLWCCGFFNFWVS